MSIVSRINELEKVMYGVGQEMFGTYTKRSKNVNRRQKKCETLKTQLRHLRQAFRKADAGSDDQIAIGNLERDTREKLNAAKRSENSRKRRWKRKQLRNRFYKDPCAVAKEVMEPKRTFNEPKASVADLNAYLSQVCTDELKNVDLGPLDGLPDLQCDLSAFDTKDLSYRDLEQTTKTRRNGSKPGSNMLLYKVYKKAPRLLRKVFSLHKRVLKETKVPLKWKISEGVFIPKVDSPNCDGFSDFRVISLSNVEGKLLESHL